MAAGNRPTAFFFASGPVDLAEDFLAATAGLSDNSLVFTPEEDYAAQIVPEEHGHVGGGLAR